MENLENLYQKLETHSNFEIEDNCEKFLDAASNIILQQNPTSISIILKYFDDDNDYNWVFEGISCSLLHYSKEAYIKGILNNITLLNHSAKGWTKNFIYPILNDNEYLIYFKENLHIASQKLLLNIFNEIYHESPKHRSIILDLQARLKSE